MHKYPVSAASLGVVLANNLQGVYLNRLQRSVTTSTRSVSNDNLLNVSLAQTSSTATEVGVDCKTNNLKSVRN